jgi:hypothetical protein
MQVRHWLAAVSALLPLAASGDAIFVSRAMQASTIAEIFVEEGGVRVELEIGAGDLQGFRNLLPDALYERLGNAPEPLAERLRRFPREDFVLRADGGAPLPGAVREIGPRVRTRRDDITGEPLPSDEEEPETVVFAVLEYALSGRPETLTLTPPLGTGRATVNLGFVTYHRGLPINDFRYLGSTETLELDWEDPWYSRFENRNLRRQYDAPVSVFLYVEPYEVRYEIVARPKDLQQWLDLGLDGRATIPVEMQAQLKERVAAFLGEQIDASIDGRSVAPVLDRIHFLRRTLRTSRVIQPPEELDLISATLGAVYVVPTEGLPQEATLSWDLFGERIQRIPAAATDEAGPLPSYLMPDDNVLRWTNFLKNPTIPRPVMVAAPPAPLLRALGAGLWLCLPALALALLWQGVRIARGRRPSGGAAVATALLLIAALLSFAGARQARMNDARAQEVLAALLHNVYRAFDAREEGAIYDALENSVAGELLAQIYLETRRGLELASQGGARVKVKDVEVVGVVAEHLDSGPGFAARGTWNVSGSVGHWGHVHQRTNRYEARFVVRPVDGTWRITELELLQEERV